MNLARSAGLWEAVLLMLTCEDMGCEVNTLHTGLAVAAASENMAGHWQAALVLLQWQAQRQISSDAALGGSAVAAVSRSARWQLAAAVAQAEGRTLSVSNALLGALKADKWRLASAELRALGARLLRPEVATLNRACTALARPKWRLAWWLLSASVWDLVSCNLALLVLSFRFWGHSLALLRAMPSMSHPPDATSFGTVIDVCARAGERKLAEELLGESKAVGGGAVCASAALRGRPWAENWALLCAFGAANSDDPALANAAMGGAAWREALFLLITLGPHATSLSFGSACAARGLPWRQSLRLLRSAANRPNCLVWARSPGRRRLELAPPFAAAAAKCCRSQLRWRQVVTLQALGGPWDVPCAELAASCSWGARSLRSLARLLDDISGAGLSAVQLL
ncbi:unnamed protein product [Effrenium voratum]|nr:unnamed protein product [Effrenium voratum]